jgi:DNA modification methylase
MPGVRLLVFPRVFQPGNVMTKPTPPNLRQALRAKSRKRRECLAERAEAERGEHQTIRNDLLPQQRFELRSIDTLSSAPRRVRRIHAAHVARLRSSIQRHGFIGAILVTSKGEIIDGHSLVEAARSAGLTAIPCLVQEHLTSRGVREARIAVNKLQELGIWDFEELKIEFIELRDLGSDLSGTGFSLPEIDLVLQDDQPDAIEQGPLAPEPHAEPLSKPGDVFALGRHRIVCGDARDPRAYEAIMAPDEQARAVLTDTPYNVAIHGHVTSGDHREFSMAAGEMPPEVFARFNADWMDTSAAWLLEGGLLGTFIDWRSVAMVIQVGQSLGFELINVPVWAKTNGGMGSLWRSQHELFPVMRKAGGSHKNNVELGKHGRYRSNVWTYPGASSLGSDARKGLKLHPTVKPTAMLEDLILDISDRGEIIIDSFLGSGSTLIACEKTGRVCRSIEIDPLYVDVALRRWMAVTGKTPRVLGNIQRQMTPLLLPAPSHAARKG